MREGYERPVGHDAGDAKLTGSEGVGLGDKAVCVG